MRHEGFLALRNNNYQFQGRRKTHAAWMFVRGSVSGVGSSTNQLPPRPFEQTLSESDGAGTAAVVLLSQVELERTMSPQDVATEQQLASLGVAQEVVQTQRTEETTTSEFYPVPAPFNICEIACGPRHVLLRTSRGLVYSFGHGEGGRLGLGDEHSRMTPTLLESISSRQCISVACGRDHSVTVLVDGTAFAFGWGEGGRLGVGEEADKVLMPRQICFPQAKTRRHSKDSPPVQYCAAGCGREHTLLLSAEGDVYFCGMEHPLDEEFECCQNAILTPTFVALPEGELAVAVAGGDAHSALLTHSGHVFTWGYGGSGALGHGNDNSFSTPQMVHKLTSYHVVQLTCGHWHTACLTSGNDFWAWGDFADERNQSLSRPEEATQLSGSETRSCVPLNFVVSRREQQLLLATASEPQMPPSSLASKQAHVKSCFQRISVGCGKSFVVGETEEIFEIDSVTTHVGLLRQVKEHSQCMQHAQLFTTSDLLVGSGDFYSVLCVQNV